MKHKTGHRGTSLVVQWLRLHASTAGDMGLIPGRGTRILHASRHGQKIPSKTGHREVLQDVGSKKNQGCKISLFIDCQCHGAPLQLTPCATTRNLESRFWLWLCKTFYCCATAKCDSSTQYAKPSINHLCFPTFTLCSSVTELFDVLCKCCFFSMYLHRGYFVCLGWSSRLFAWHISTHSSILGWSICCLRPSLPTFHAEWIMLSFVSSFSDVARDGEDRIYRPWWLSGY